MPLPPDTKFEALKEKARELLSQGLAPSAENLENLELSLDTLLEELRIYDLELQMQNQELLKAQQQMQSALTRYSVLFHGLPLPAIVISRNGIMVEANERAAQLFGFRSSKLLQNHSIYRLLEHADRQALADSLTSHTPDQSVQLEHIHVRPASGQSLWVEFHLVALSESYHLDRHFLLTVIDRTLTYQLDSQLKMLNTIIDNANARVVAYDRLGNCLYVNNEAAKAIGSDPAAIVGNNRNLWMSDEQAKTAIREDSMVLTSGIATVNEEKQTSVEGNRYFLVHRFPVFLRDPEVPAGVASMSSEITQRKEDQIRLQLAISAFSKGHEGIMITNEYNTITYVNAAFERITGYSEAEAIGQNPSFLSSGRQDAAFYKDMWSDIRRNGYWEGEIWDRDKHGRIYPAWLSISHVSAGPSDETHYIGVFSDTTKRKLAEQEIEQLAFYDTLTGIPNRYLLNDRVDQAIHRASRDGTSFAIAFFDLDHFKQINDVHGHDVGDEILKHVAKRVVKIVREQDTISRLGGDEFVLLMEHIDVDAVKQRVEHILLALTRPFELESATLETSASIGIAMYPSDGHTFNVLLKSADTAMYAAKDQGRGTYRFFGGEMAKSIEQRVDLFLELRAAQREGRFNLAFQPQMSLSDNRVEGVEVLLRWQRGNGEHVSPGVFIPLAEQSGLIEDIGTWVIRHSFQNAADFQTKSPGLRFAVNISARQFESHDFIQNLEDALEESGLAAHNIELEITESVVMHEPEKAMKKMQQLNKMGFWLAIDDFGTGYSSLAYLHWMPVDTIKIDQTFVSHIGEAQHDEIICQSIISLAKSLNIRTVAEGVQTEAQLQFLKQAGCDHIQGYLLSPPMPKETLEQWHFDRPIKLDTPLNGT